MKYGRSIKDLAAEIDRQQEAKVDFKLDTRHLHMSVGANDSQRNTGETIWMGIGDKMDVQIKQVAHRQIGTHTEIPAKYYDRMKDKAPGLLATNVNRWFQNESSRRMVRVLDNRMRAFLSDRYKRIDNYDVSQAIFPILKEIDGLEIKSCEITDRNLFIKATSPRSCGEVTVGDVVEAGVMVRNSEIGFGRFLITPFIHRLVCDNGMVLNDSRFGRNHVGAIDANADNNIIHMLSDETLAAEDKAIMLKSRDVVRACLDQVFVDQTVARLRQAAGQKIHGDPVIAIEIMSKKMNLTQEEQGGVLRHLIEGGDLSAWGMANAVTRLATDAESYDRATDLEIIGGKVVDLGPHEWNQIAEAA